MPEIPQDPSGKGGWPLPVPEGFPSLLFFAEPFAFLDGLLNQILADNSLADFINRLGGLTHARFLFIREFNDIRSESKGRVAAILVQNGQLVQKGQALIEIVKE